MNRTSQLTAASGLGDLRPVEGTPSPFAGVVSLIAAIGIVSALTVMMTGSVLGHEGDMELDHVCSEDSEHDSTGRHMLYISTPHELTDPSSNSHVSAGSGVSDVSVSKISNTFNYFGTEVTVSSDEFVYMISYTVDSLPGVVNICWLDQIGFWYPIYMDGDGNGNSPTDTTTTTDTSTTTDIGTNTDTSTTTDIGTDTNPNPGNDRESLSTSPVDSSDSNPNPNPVPKSEATPTPTPTPTATHTPKPTVTPTPATKSSGSSNAARSPVDFDTPTPSPTPKPSPSLTPSSTPTPSPTPIPSPTRTAIPVIARASTQAQPATPTPTPTPTPTVVPATPLIREPTVFPSPTPTLTPGPTTTPTRIPIPIYIAEPTVTPTPAKALEATLARAVPGTATPTPQPLDVQGTPVSPTVESAPQSSSGGIVDKLQTRISLLAALVALGIIFCAIIAFLIRRRRPSHGDA